MCLRAIKIKYKRKHASQMCNWFLQIKLKKKLAVHGADVYNECSLFYIFF